MTKNIIISIILTFWLIFALTLCAIDLYNRNLSSESRIPTFSEIKESLHKQNEEWNKNVCITPSKDRYFVNGPYTLLTPGEYQIQFDLMGKSNLFTDVSYEKGKKIIYSTDFVLDSPDKYTTYNFDFKVDNWIMSANNAEFRILSQDGQNVCINKITLITKQKNFIKLLDNLPKNLYKLFMWENKWRY